MAAIFGTAILCQSLEYRPGFGPKQMAWILHAGVMGAMIAPLCFMGGQILTRAALYTAGVVGGLSAIAVSKKIVSKDFVTNRLEKYERILTFFNFVFFCRCVPQVRSS